MGFKSEWYAAGYDDAKRSGELFDDDYDRILDGASVQDIADEYRKENRRHMNDYPVWEDAVDEAGGSNSDAVIRTRAYIDGFADGLKVVMERDLKDRLDYEREELEAEARFWAGNPSWPPRRDVIAIAKDAGISGRQLKAYTNEQDDTFPTGVLEDRLVEQVLNASSDQILRYVRAGE